jgi:hypothetical protein
VILVSLMCVLIGLLCAGHVGALVGLGIGLALWLAAAWAA